MADAGKVAMLPRGQWSANTIYEPLDLVFYNNNSYVSFKESIGIEPTNTEFWMLALSGVGQEVIDAIINGTQQVGDSAKLGGKDASKYITTEGGEIKSTKNTPLKLNVSTGGSLVVLQEFLADDKSYGHLGFESANKPICRTTDGNYRELLHTGNMASHVLPLSGGTITGGYTPLTIKNGKTNGSAIGFEGIDGALGYLGVGGTGFPMFMLPDGTTQRELLHTGNKPTGTYTGNGSATERTINTGGIGNAVLIYAGNNLFSIVSTNGAISLGNTTIVGYLNTEVKFVNGVLTIASTSSAFNLSNITYYYQVL